MGIPASLSFALPDEDATTALGRRLAAHARAGDVIALNGPLGAGKSVLARGFIRALTRPDEDVPSPTFTLVQTYGSARGEIWHFDLFRLERAEEALELGIEEAFPGAISLIEWPERLGRFLPADRLDVTLAADDRTGIRQAELAGGPAWTARLELIAHD